MKWAVIGLCAMGVAVAGFIVWMVRTAPDVTVAPVAQPTAATTVEAPEQPKYQQPDAPVKWSQVQSRDAAARVVPETPKAQVHAQAKPKPTGIAQQPAKPKLAIHSKIQAVLPLAYGLPAAQTLARNNWYEARDIITRIADSGSPYTSTAREILRLADQITNEKLNGVDTSQESNQVIWDLNMLANNGVFLE